MIRHLSSPATVVALTVLAGSVAMAGDTSPGVVLYTPGDMKWTDWGISAQRAVLAGNPNHHGCAYTDRVKFLANTKVEPHSLPEDKIYTVISGTLYVGIGDKWDESRLRKMPAGSFWTIPANVSRFFKAEEQVIFQSTAMANSNRKDCVDTTVNNGKK